MLYLITHGSYSDYDHDAIIEVDGPLDLAALEAEYRQVMIREAPADYGEIYYSENTPHTKRQIAWHDFETGHFIDWIVANHGARRLGYTELNTDGGALRVAKELPAPQYADSSITAIVNGVKTNAIFKIYERQTVEGS